MSDRGTPVKSFMEGFATTNENVIDILGDYDPVTQRWVGPQDQTMRTNYQTWNRTQQFTNQHTAGGDTIADNVDDNDPDQASD